MSKSTLRPALKYNTLWPDIVFLKVNLKYLQCLEKPMFLVCLILTFRGNSLKKWIKAIYFPLHLFSINYSFELWISGQCK